MVGLFGSSKVRDEFVRTVAGMGFDYAEKASGRLSLLDNEKKTFRDVAVGRTQDGCVLVSGGPGGNGMTVGLFLGRNVPDVVLAPNMPDSVWRKLGLVPVKFESSRFNATFDVASRDARFASGFFHPLLMEELLSVGSDAGVASLAFLVSNGWLLAGSAVGSVDLTVASGWLEVLTGSVVPLVPRWMSDDYGVDFGAGLSPVEAGCLLFPDLAEQVERSRPLVEKVLAR